MKRWIYVPIGVLILLFAGLIYAWSVMSTSISKEFVNYNNTQLSVTFTICMTFFCLGGLIGGMLQKKIKVKINLLIASVLFLIGFYMSSRAHSIIVLYIGYGVLCGLGSGLAYNGVISTVSKWFLDKQGLISGILLMGFGIGSFIMGKLFQQFTPPQIDGWRTSFLVLGVVIFLVLLIGSNFIVKPTQEFIDEILDKAENKNSKLSKSKVSLDEGLDMTPKEMIKRPSFILYFIWATLIGAIGLILISQAMGVASFVGEDIDAGTIATVVGFISILNAVGRVVCGALYDRFGRLFTMRTIVIVIILSSASLMLSVKLDNFMLIILGFCMCGFSYGGVTSVNSAFINAFYGPTNYPVNFSINNLNLIIASFGSTIAGFVYDMSGTYMGVFILMFVLSLLSYVCAVSIKRP